MIDSIAINGCDKTLIMISGTAYQSYGIPSEVSSNTLKMMDSSFLRDGGSYDFSKKRLTLTQRYSLSWHHHQQGGGFHDDGS